MSEALSGRWQAPLRCTVVGSTHRRLGKPCQDASLVRSLSDPGGMPLQLMAVADGHGGGRYWLSDVGSQLACEQAVLAVARALAEHPLADETRWRQLLAGDLPAAIQTAWLEATASHWQQRPEAADQPFSPLTYGCTLGLVLLAPTWWGHTGLGDWDLVRRSSDGSMALISEEREPGASGEATASLCMTGAASLFAQRAALHPLTPGHAPLALVLSTDGVRKSCATDDDFLALGHHLAALRQPAALEAALEQITSQGSGDDVSIAIACWEAGGSPPQAPHRQGVPLVLLLGLGAAALAAGLWWLQPWARRITAPKPAAPDAASLRAEVQRLCTSPDRIPTALTQRQAQFDQLLQGKQQAQTLLQQASLDPLGAVIATSLPMPTTPASSANTSALVELNACPALLSALDQQWKRRRAAAAKMPAPENASPPPRSAP